ncbi:DNA topoisomerase IV subunit A [Alphaproteobacteria bacterium HT1-32]|nr:DNA topoisomerase IV subunit A [Alphaproteobacteria bacterium HT1-32]
MSEPVRDDTIRPVELKDALGERYLAYALSTIMSRSLPDVRDGLKPVHRRLLFAMQQLKLDPASGYKKCARVVGDVIGKYHPHGDSAVYEALVRLAQDFAQRYPLIDGQGNFGNIDGDNAAAMRYTESRLTQVAQALLQGINEDAIDFRSTYDGEEQEPVVLPSAFPNLLANGSAGIAVGMATSIPPHNAHEICDALKHLIKFPNATIAKLVEYMPGPDFPTGGELVESPESVQESYSTGRGSFRVRAKWEVEKLNHGLYHIVVTEIPYQVQKSRLIEKIADLLQNRKLPMLADVRDESTDLVRLVIEPRNRTIDPEQLMEQLFRQTDLESRFSLNMNVLDADHTPKVMNLREVLQAFLDHRHVVLLRRSRFRLGKIEHRLEVLGGLLIAYLNLDEVIRIIREEDQPKAELIRTFDLTDLQAESILNMRLRHLRKLEEMEIRREHDELMAEKLKIEELLSDDQLQWKTITWEISEIQKAFGKDTALGKRRTVIGDAPTAVVVPLEAFIEREPITVVCSEKGWIRAFKGHLADMSDLKYKDGDNARFAFHAQTTDKIIAFSTNGRFYTLGADKLPRGRGHGEPIRISIDLPNDHDLVTLFVHQPDRKLLVASTAGRGFAISENDVIAQTRTGKQILNVKGHDEAYACRFIDGDSVAVIGNNRKLLVFPLDELPEMARGQGVMLQRYKDGALSDIKVFKAEDGLSWRSGERTRTETDLITWIGKRGQAGRLAPRGFAVSNRFD